MVASSDLAGALLPMLQLGGLCTALAHLAARPTLGFPRGAMDFETFAVLLAQIVFFLALPCFTFTLGLTCAASAETWLAAVAGVARAGLGACVGLAAAWLVEQLCSSRIPVLSSLWSRGSSSSALVAVAATTARAFGSPQAASSLLPTRTPLPPGLRLSLVMACTFPASLPLLPSPLLSPILDPVAAASTHGVAIGLVLALWIGARHLLPSVLDDTGSFFPSGPLSALRQGSASPSSGGGGGGSNPAFPSLRTFVRMPDNQDVLVTGGAGNLPAGASQGGGSGTARGGTSAAASGTTGSDGGTGEMYEAVVTDLGGLSRGRGELGDGGSGRLGGSASRSGAPWAAYDTEASSSTSEEGWASRLARRAGSVASDHLPAVALVAGLLAQRLLLAPLPAPGAAVHPLPWDGTLLAALLDGFLQAVASLAPALHTLLLLNVACLCTAADQGSQGTLVASPAGRWARLRGLLLPSQPLDLLLLATALLGSSLASHLVSQTADHLTEGLLDAATLLPGISPDLSTVVLIQMLLLSRSPWLRGLRADAARQLVVLLARMAVWGPLVARAVAAALAVVPLRA